MRKGQKLSPEERAKRVTTLAALKLNGGNISKTSRETGTPRTTVRKWRDENTEAAKALKAKKEKAQAEANLKLKEAEQAAIAEETEAVVKLSATELEACAADLLKSIHEDIKNPKLRFALRDKGIVFGIVHDKLQLSKGEATSIIGTVGNMTTEQRAEAAQKLLETARQRRLNDGGREMGVLDGGKAKKKAKA